MIRALAALVLVAAVAGCASDEPEPRPSTLPDLTLAGFDGAEDIDLTALDGPTIINLWASTCGPCVVEMPLLEEFHQKHGDQVAVIGIDYQDTQTDKAAELVKESGVTYDLVSDPKGEFNDNAAIPRIPALPFWVAVDADGTVTEVKAMAAKSLDDIVALAESTGVDL